MVLNEREVKILEKFYYNNEIKLSDLSSKFNITERMVRYNISRINELLRFIKIKPIIKNDRGYYIFDNKHPKILELIKELEPIDKFKRIKLIKLILCYSNKKITVEYFSKLFNISRITINNYIKEINVLLKNKIKIVNDNGLIILGEDKELLEFKISVLADMINELDLESINDYNKIIKSIIFEIIKFDDYDELKKLADSIIKKFNLKINIINYNLYLSKLIYIFIYNYDYKNFNDEIFETEEYKFIKDNTVFSENILKNIAYVSIWLRSYNDFEKDYKDIVNIEIITKDIIKKVSDKININLVNDKLLNEFLVEHLKLLIYRIKEGYKIKSVYIPEEEKVCDELYNYILESTSIISEILNININNNEIHLIRLHFLASIDRYKSKIEKPTDIIIITDLGIGSKKILLENINSKFLVNIEYIGSEFQLNKKMILDYNSKIILTTNELNKDYFLDKVIIKINPILSNKDIENLKKIGLKNKNNKIVLSDLLRLIRKYSDIKNENEFIEELLIKFGNCILIEKNLNNKSNNIILSENIIFDYNEDNIEKAIRKSLEILEGDYTNKSYTDEVLKILKEKPMNLIRYNGVIIPHSKNKNNVFKSGISIINLENPIRLNDKEQIDVIVTFAIENEKNMLDSILSVITKVFTKDFKEILRLKNKLQLIDYLENTGGEYSV